MSESHLRGLGGPFFRAPATSTSTGPCRVQTTSSSTHSNSSSAPAEHSGQAASSERWATTRLDRRQPDSNQTLVLDWKVVIEAKYFNDRLLLGKQEVQSACRLQQSVGSGATATH